MVLDYSERRQVNRNRPRRQFPWGMLLTNVIILAVGYAAGVGTGWIFFHRPSVAPVPVPKAASVPSPSPAPRDQPVSAPAKPTDPPLTFYETLPKGSKQVILGTGINQIKNEQQSKPAAIPVGAGSPAGNEKSSEKGATPSVQTQAATDASKVAVTTVKPESAKGTFSVQISSCKTREEAEAVKAKNRNVQAYIVESVVPGKGTWYRVRTGRKLDRQRADELAAKIGGQAIIVAE